ncbi:hypothetical protein ACIPW5_39110 [Streptomyces sp. NPDC090077]|uniref:hypothetical protein n=1 Tax=Streptomyces sp. NPDC090077 TaxID=3365938 RepID=UPI0038026AAB
MDDEKRTAEARERSAHRAAGPRARLERAYADRTGPDALHAEHRRPEAPAPDPRPGRSRTDEQGNPAASTAETARRRQSEPPANEARTRTTARLDAAYADRTGPDALQAERRRTPAQPARPQQAPDTSTAPPQQQEQAPTARKRRNVSARLDQAYDRDQRGQQNDLRPDRRRKQPPPQRPDGPRI